MREIATQSFATNGLLIIMSVRETLAAARSFVVPGSAQHLTWPGRNCEDPQRLYESWLPAKEIPSWICKPARMKQEDKNDTDHRIMSMRTRNL
ncbi:hypothetical protein FHT77_003539 [Rhizobium sp. BK181]|nr:hypothetical protein [Rhizobium sp. BK181]